MNRLSDAIYPNHLLNIYFHFNSNAALEAKWSALQPVWEGCFQTTNLLFLLLWLKKTKGHVNKNDWSTSRRKFVVVFPVNALTYSVCGCTIYCRQRRLHSDSYCCWFTAGSYDTRGKTAGMLNLYHATMSPARTISLLRVLSIAVVTCDNNDQQLR